LSLTTISVSRPVTTVMFFLGIALLGVISFTQISVNFLPPIEIPELFVETDFSNASASEVEKTITKPIESIVSTVDGINNISSVSRDGRSLITLELAWGTDVNYTMLEVREKLDEIRSSLPENTDRSTIYKIDPSTESIMTLAINFNKGNSTRISEGQNSNQNDYKSSINYSENRSLSELKEFSETLIKKRLDVDE